MSTYSGSLVFDTRGLRGGLVALTVLGAFGTGGSDLTLIM